MIIHIYTKEREEKPMSDNNTSSRGISFCGLLTVLFIGLKLTDYIDWSWWWVLSPMWLPFVVVFVVALLILSFTEIFK